MCVFFVSFDMLMICVCFYIVVFWVVMTKNSVVWCCQCFHVASWDHTVLHLSCPFSWTSWWTHYHCHYLPPLMMITTTTTTTTATAHFFHIFSIFFRNSGIFILHFIWNLTCLTLQHQPQCTIWTPYSLHAAWPCVCYGHECIYRYLLGWVCFRVANFRHYLTLLQRSKM
jgi:hypothetical protein